MDLTCPSFVHDETSDYGSRDNSNDEPAIGGLCQVAYPNGNLYFLIGTFSLYELYIATIKFKQFFH